MSLKILALDALVRSDANVDNPRKIAEMIFKPFDEKLHNNISNAIYKFRCLINEPNEYIGQTVQMLCKRFKDHKNPTDMFYFQYALTKHGWDNFEKMFYECPEERLNDHETFWITVLGTHIDMYPGGYNLTMGGEGTKLSPEQRAARSGANHWAPRPAFQYNVVYGTKIDEFAAISEAALCTGISRANITECINGNYRTAGGFFWSDHELDNNEVQDLISKKLDDHWCNKSVFQYDIKTGVLIDEYTSQIEANKKTGVNTAHICECVKRERQTAGNFYWSDHRLAEGEIRMLISKKLWELYGKAVYRFTKNDNVFIDWFLSAKSAKEVLELYDTADMNIRSCANPKLKRSSACGYRWSYDPPSGIDIGPPRS